MIIATARIGMTVPRPAFTLVSWLEFCDELEGVVSGEAVVEWLLVFTGIAGLTAVVVDCGVIF